MQTEIIWNTNPHKYDDVILHNTPKNQLLEVLHYLLHTDNATTRDIQYDCHVLNVTAKISELRKWGVQIACTDVKVKNKYGREITFGKYNIINFTEAKKIYNTKNQ